MKHGGFPGVFLEVVWYIYFLFLLFSAGEIQAFTSLISSTCYCFMPEQTARQPNKCMGGWGRPALQAVVYKGLR